MKTPYPGAGGKHKLIKLNPEKGKYAKYRLPRHARPVGIAVDATLRASVRRQGGELALPIKVEYQDIMQKLRRNRTKYTLVFIVDNSWSTHVDKSLQTIKELVFSILQDARLQRDRVSLVAFRHSRAPQGVIVLPPTRSYTLAYRRLQNIPLCGSTPLADAMVKAYHLLQVERRKNLHTVPIMALVTDGIPTFPLQPHNSPEKEVLEIAKKIGKGGVATVVIDTSNQARTKTQSCCRQIAHNAHGQYLPWSALTRSNLLRAIDEALVGRG